MSTEILISSDPWENRVAILEDGTLAELYIEREERVIGSIYKGKVQNVLPGMGAAFVDIGLGRNAFLYVDDINKQPLNIGDVEITHGYSGFTISEKVKKGDDVLVQIVKEPRGLKGARISTNISLPGRYLILMPTGRYSGVSRKIDSADERNRLKAVMKRIRPEGMATVVRTAAANVSEAELIADLGVLIRMWHGILETFKRAPSPSLLHKDMNLVYKAARDFITADVDKVYIDNENEHRKVREFLQLLGPQYLDRVSYYDAGRNLFDDYKITEELQKLMKPKIGLPSGGSIVIETTEALTVIDVNSGKFTGGKNLEDTIVKTNLEAAKEIARQVRLRDIGGIIVIDFIDMNTDASRDKVIKALEDGLRRDRTRATIQSFSNLGLLEFTRKRVGKDLGAQLRGACPTCTGLGSVMSPQSVAIDAFRQVRAEKDVKGQAVVVHAAPSVASQMEYWYEDECGELTQELGCEMHVRVDPALHPEHTRVERVAHFKEDTSTLVRVGDERDVELLGGRLPNATSAAAVLNGHLVEVENAANNAGNVAKIRVIDVDDKEDRILAELVTAAAATRKKRRRARGPLTAAEQAAELRELAKEAAESHQARPPIGITTITEEEERQDRTLRAEVKGEKARDAIVIAPPAEGEVEGEGQRRRRRRRGRRGRGGASRDAMIAAGIPPQSAEVQIESAEEHEATPRAIPTIIVGGTAEGGRRRRRRRGRRGRGGLGAGQQVEPLTGSLPPKPPLPERHVFRVGSDGAAEATGVVAPREPSRAIEPLRRAHPPAVNAPPPHLTAPEEKPQAVKPARGRRRPSPAAPGELQTTRVAALPPPEAAAAAEPRSRKTAATTAAAPKRSTTRTKAAKAEKPAAAEPKPKRTASTASTARTAKTAPEKKATPTLVRVRFDDTSKKSPATSPVKKATTRKKSSTTTTRKKKKS